MMVTDNHGEQRRAGPRSGRPRAGKKRKETMEKAGCTLIDLQFERVKAVCLRLLGLMGPAYAERFLAAELKFMADTGCAEIATDELRRQIVAAIGCELPE